MIRKLDEVFSKAKDLNTASQLRCLNDLVKEQVVSLEHELQVIKSTTSLPKDLILFL